MYLPTCEAGSGVWDNILVSLSPPPPTPCIAISKCKTTTSLSRLVATDMPEPQRQRSC